MGTSREVIDLRAGRHEQPAVAELCDEWSRVSRERLGLSRQQWHHPATTELLRALLGGHDPRPALVRLGEARAAAGLSLAKTLGDLAIVHELEPRAIGRTPVDLDSLAAAACVGTAWAQAFYGPAEPPSCVDELTGLVTVAFLEARLDQIHRHCAHLGMPPTAAYALVVAQICRDDASPFTWVAQRLRLAGDLRLCFPGSDTLAVLASTESTQRMVALTSRTPELTTAVDALARGAGRRQVHVASMPGEATEAIRLVRRLADGIG